MSKQKNLAIFELEMNEPIEALESPSPKVTNSR